MEIKSIREQGPLKQGLKLSGFGRVEGLTTIREQDPLKQGLKPVFSISVSCFAIIREQDPLKQESKCRRKTQIREQTKSFVSKIH